MSEIAKIVRQQVEREGVLPFAEFMRLALYCPKYGYYEQLPGRIGREGDFYTNVSLGSLFGELLAFQFAQWLEKLPAGPLQLVEAGAHNGQLAADILTWFSQQQPGLVSRLQYWIIEPSARRQTWQAKELEHFAHLVRWSESLAALPAGAVTGVIFSNELLDAMPVQRLGWDANERCWFEWGVALGIEHRQHSDVPSHGFIWKKIPRPPDYFAAALREAGLEIPSEVLAVLPDGFTIDLCSEAASWWREAARTLKAGKLLAIDYGFQAEDFLRPERARGTLRAYHRHHASDDLLAYPGEQDLTAHVNFTQLRRLGEATGLSTEGLFSQERFFTRLAARTWQDGSGFGEWTPARRRQFHGLTHPEHLGRPFSVFVQTRGSKTLLPKLPR